MERGITAGGTRCGVVCERGLVFRIEKASVLHLEAQQRAQGRRGIGDVRCPIAREGGGASEGNDEVRTREGQRETYEKERIAPNPAICTQRNAWA
jgi:uncharacterized protein YjcR